MLAVQQSNSWPVISTAWPHLSAPALPVSHGPEPISPAPPLQRKRAGEFTFPSHYNSSWRCPTLKSSLYCRTKKQTSLWFPVVDALLQYDEQRGKCMSSSAELPHWYIDTYPLQLSHQAFSSTPKISQKLWQRVGCFRGKDICVHCRNVTLAYLSYLSWSLIFYTMHRADTINFNKFI